MTPFGHSMTSRQREFLLALIRLWTESGAAVHYSQVAEAMGVSRFSAYDMLRVLETQGQARSSYVLEYAGPATGRSSVCYAPTDAGLAAASAGGSPRTEEWRSFRDRLLGQLAQGRTADEVALIDDLLEQIPKRLSPLFYCSEVIAALLLNLNSAREKISGLNPLDTLKSLTSSPSEMGFAMLAGLSLGAGRHAHEDRGRSRQLVDYTQRYQELLREVGEDGKRLLSDFLQDAMDTIMGAALDKRRKEGGTK